MSPPSFILTFAPSSFRKAHDKGGVLPRRTVHYTLNISTLYIVKNLSDFLQNPRHRYAHGTHREEYKSGFDQIEFDIAFFVQRIDRHEETDDDTEIISEQESFVSRLPVEVFAKGRDICCQEEIDEKRRRDDHHEPAIRQGFTRQS